MATKSSKKNTGKELHIFGWDIDVYRTVWEDRNTGSWFVLLAKIRYEVDHMGKCEQLNGAGYRTCFG
jgi:hypothetical protein